MSGAPEPAIADRRFKITYVSRRPARVVTGEHFDKSAAFHPVLKLEVGEAITGRYYSAGYRKVERIA